MKDKKKLTKEDIFKSKLLEKKSKIKDKQKITKS